MRTSGVRDVLIYCRDHRCSHSATASADRWPGSLRLSDGRGAPFRMQRLRSPRGAEIRPNFKPARMGTG